jgi:hypothetical protein
VTAAAAGLAPLASSTAEADPSAAAALTAPGGAFPLASSTPAAPGNSAVQAGPSEVSSPGGGAPGQGAARSIPGTDAAIQRWFLDNGAVKVRFNDALLQAQRAVASADAAGCRPLDAGTRALAAALPALGRLSPAGQKLTAAMQPPLTTFAAAATACLANDFAAAQAALDSGVVQQAEAQESVDEILDGDE